MCLCRCSHRRSALVLDPEVYNAHMAHFQEFSTEGRVLRLYQAAQGARLLVSIIPIERNVVTGSTVTDLYWFNPEWLLDFHSR